MKKSLICTLNEAKGIYGKGKRNLEKIFVVLFVTVILSGGTLVHAAEPALTESEEETENTTNIVLQDSVFNCEGLPQEFDNTVSFDVIEDNILKFINERGISASIGTPEYLDLMYNILFGEVPNITDLTSRYFSAYASVYVTEVQKSNVGVNDKTRKQDVAVQLSGTIAEAKEQNMILEDQIKKDTKTLTPSTRAGFSVARAQDYASRYAMTWNYPYGRHSSDCTNFASQIVEYAGMPLVPGVWQWNGNAQAKRTWNVAEDFTNYWSLIRGYAGGSSATKAGLKSIAQAGDFITYRDKDTYAMWHVTFVQRKSGSTIYVSQHTTDRFNYNWDLITIPNSFYLITRIR